MQPQSATTCDLTPAMLASADTSVALAQLHKGSVADKRACAVGVGEEGLEPAGARAVLRGERLRGAPGDLQEGTQRGHRQLRAGVADQGMLQQA